MTLGQAETNLKGAETLLRLRRAYGWDTGEQERVVAKCRAELKRVEGDWA